MTERIRISTIIATHNRAALLLEALDSLRTQERPPDEIVVVDDGSGPDTRCAVEGWRRRHDGAAPALQYFYQDNAGPAVARNRGLAASSGSHLQFLDDDDLLAPDALRQLASVLEDRRGAAVSLASYAHLQADTAVPARGGPTVAPARARPSQCLADMIAGQWFVPVHGYLFTREAVARMGDWDPVLGSQEDDDYLFRAVLRGVDFVPAPAALVYYRAHDGVRRATPGKPGESVQEGLRQRLLDDLTIRERVFRELRARGVHERLRAAFEAWHRRLCERYAAQLADIDDADWAVLAWLAQARPRLPRGRVSQGQQVLAAVPLRRAR